MLDARDCVLLRGHYNIFASAYYMMRYRCCLDHQDLSSLDERLAKAKFTKISVHDIIGLWNISMTTT